MSDKRRKVRPGLKVTPSGRAKPQRESGPDPLTSPGQKSQPEAAARPSHSRRSKGRRWRSDRLWPREIAKEIFGPPTLKRARKPKKKNVEEALRPLIGLPLTLFSRAAAMLMVGFGVLRSVPTRDRRTRQVRDFDLHIQSSWRFRKLSRILIGCSDMYYPADLPWTEPVPDGFDWDVSGANRCDGFFASFMARHPAKPIHVTSVASDDVGGFRLAFSEGYELEVFPDTGTPDEVWRLCRPGSSEHFVR